MASIKGNEELIVAGVVSAIEITNLNDDEVKDLTEVYRAMQRLRRGLRSESLDESYTRIRREWLAERLRKDATESHRPTGSVRMPQSDTEFTTEGEAGATLWRKPGGDSEAETDVAETKEDVLYTLDDRRHEEGGTGL